MSRDTAVAHTAHANDPRPRLALVTHGVQRIETLPALLNDWSLIRAGRRTDADAVLAWGYKPSAMAAQRYAQHHGLELIRAEDGFLRSVGLGHQAPPLSIVLDPEGIYYDASRPSRLESLIATPCNALQHARGQALQASWVKLRLSKYNHAVDTLPKAAVIQQQAQASPVLVIDQTMGDASIAGAGARPVDFHHMLQAALDEHPQAPIWLKTHPDVLSGRKRGHFDITQLPKATRQRITLVDSVVHPPALLSVCRAVYVVSSQMGFEALLWSRPVRCFGMPFYGGWGLTQDEKSRPSRRQVTHVDSATLSFAALVAYARYIDPDTGRPCQAEDLMAHLARQRQHLGRWGPRIHVLGFSPWKHAIAQRFLQGSHLTFTRRTTQRPDTASVVAVWGRQPVPQVDDVQWIRSGQMESRKPPKVLRIEDGFLRSVGLGADLTAPLSWVIDDEGIYFDATRTSRLERLLLNHAFDMALKKRAADLRAHIVRMGLTKYNIGRSAWRKPADLPPGTPVILVPGQVETDASLQWGSADMQRNIDLLSTVRLYAPKAYIIFKPHPDVWAGLRQGGHAWVHARERFSALCDAIITDVSMDVLLQAVDEVHTLTSLTGFEALLRGKLVHTWGIPFYAGWGLTQDHAPSAHPAWQRRHRRLSLDELVAGCLILYPTYVSRHSGTFTTPERALEELQTWRQQSDGRDHRGANAWHWIKRQCLIRWSRLRGR